MSPQIPAWVNPDLHCLMKVHKSTNGSSFHSWAESKVDLPAGALFARINGITVATKRQYATVQAGRDLHVAWNSDIYFINHSCDPTLECDWSTFEIRVNRQKDLKKGDTLSVFYPSTEWTLDREFDCWCSFGQERCLGRIKGAKDMRPDALKKYWLNDYIQDLLRESEMRRNQEEAMTDHMSNKTAALQE